MDSNLDYEKAKFAFYQSGCYIADIVFSSDKILHRSRHLETREWSSYTVLELAGNTYDDNLSEAWRRFMAAQKIGWDGKEEVFLSDNSCYRRYLSVDGTVDGRKATAWLWVKQGEGAPVDFVVYQNEIKAILITYRDRCNILVKPGYEDLTVLKLWREDPLLSKDLYGVQHAGSFYVKTRDGANLATDVWLPAGIGADCKIPALTVRTPYERHNGVHHWFRFVRRGYALVVQDVRGREDSDGEWVPYKHDRNDGDDTLNWIAAQPWSDGHVGMIGASYLGYVQWATAASGNPHLKAIVSMVAAGPPFIDIKRKGGIYPSGALAWAFRMAGQRGDRAASIRDDWSEVEKIRPIKDIPLKVLGKSIHFWDEYMEHPDNDAYWQNTDWTLLGDKVNVPSIIISGWFDDNGMGSTAAWEMNAARGRANQKSVWGPWKHQFNATREIHGVRFGDNAIRYDLDVLVLQWFDRFLKHIKNGVELVPAVQYYQMGENEWVEAAAWPPDRAVSRNFYLHSDGHAQTSDGDGTVKSVPPADQPFDSYVFDPHDPAPFLIDVSENEMNVPENYKEVDQRSDVLVYTSEVLKEDIAIAGNVYAEIYAASSAKDTDWLVRLEDVDENANSIRLVDGIIRARYRKSFEVPELLEPGKVEKYEIRMAKVANTFKKGHRMRVSITSGAQNLTFPNHNTGNNVPDDVNMIQAEQKVYHDERYPSHVKLPIISGSI